MGLALDNQDFSGSHPSQDPNPNWQAKNHNPNLGPLLGHVKYWVVRLERGFILIVFFITT